jgi:hypothetical protein
MHREKKTSLEKMLKNRQSDRQTLENNTERGTSLVIKRETEEDKRQR